MSKEKTNALPKVTTIGELMDALRGGKTTRIGLPIKAGSGSLAKRLDEGKSDQPAKCPRELSDFDGLMRRCHRHYGRRLSDEVLLRAIDAVAEHKRCIVHQVRRMTFAEFNTAIDQAAGKPRYGPDPAKRILYWNGASYTLTHKNWLFLSAVWGQQRVPFAEIAEAVWGDDATPDNRIRQLIYRVNKQLTKHRIGLFFVSDGERVSPVSDWPK